MDQGRHQTPITADGNRPLKPLPLARINRLLRPLRASVANLVASLDAADARIPAPSRSQSQGKGKGKAKSRDEDQDDEDWNTRATKKKKKRNSLPRYLVDNDVTENAGEASSSPFHQAVRGQRHKTKTRYGGASKKRTAAGKEVPSENGGVGTSRSRSGSGFGYGSSYSQRRPKPRPWVDEFETFDLNEADTLDRSTHSKALHLAKCYNNVLECVYGDKRRSRETPGALHPDARGLSSLVEIVARKIGAEVEESVRTIIGEMEEEKETMTSFDVEEERTKLVDELYESLPAYARGWMMVQHATCIIIDALGHRNFETLLHLSELSRNLEATSESTMFFRPLLSLALSSPKSSASIPSRANNILTLSRFTTGCHMNWNLFDKLEPFLLSSTFSDRLFFHPFLDLSRVLTGIFKDDGRRIAEFLRVMVDVAGEMLGGIDSLADEDDDEEEIDGRNELKMEIVERLEGQIEWGYGAILENLMGENGPRNRDIGVVQLANSLIDLIHAYPHETIETLFPLTVTLLLGLTPLDYNSPTRGQSLPLLISLLHFSTQFAPFNFEKLYPTLEPLFYSHSCSIMFDLVMLLQKTTVPDLQSVAQHLATVTLYHGGFEVLSGTIIDTNDEKAQGYDGGMTRDELLASWASLGLDVSGREPTPIVELGSDKTIRPSSSSASTITSTPAAQPKATVSLRKRRVVDPLPSEEDSDVEDDPIVPDSDDEGDSWGRSPGIANALSTPARRIADGKLSKTPLSAGEDLTRPFRLRKQVLRSAKKQAGKWAMESESEDEEEPIPDSDEEVALDQKNQAQVNDDWAEDGDLSDVSAESPRREALDLTLEDSDVEDPPSPPYSSPRHQSSPSSHGPQSFPRTPLLPTSDRDDLDLLASARMKKRAGLAHGAHRKIVKRPKVIKKAASLESEESDDELAL
ncbi:hypothetical protein T439DRAFT_377466 [Meredithblackwellia eburnea MCA 4105]